MLNLRLCQEYSFCVQGKKFCIHNTIFLLQFKVLAFPLSYLILPPCLRDGQKYSYPHFRYLERLINHGHTVVNLSIQIRTQFLDKVEWKQTHLVHITFYQITKQSMCVFTCACIDIHTHISARMLSSSVVSNSLRPRGLQPTRLLCPQDFPSKNTGVGSPFLPQGIFLTQGSNLCLPCLLHCRQILLLLSPRGSPNIYIWA